MLSTVTYNDRGNAVNTDGLKWCQGFTRCVNDFTGNAGLPRTDVTFALQALIFEIQLIDLHLDFLVRFPFRRYQNGSVQCCGVALHSKNAMSKNIHLNKRLFICFILGFSTYWDHGIAQLDVGSNNWLEIGGGARGVRHVGWPITSVHQTPSFSTQ